MKKRNNTEEENVNFFASTPPLEAVKLLISEAMTKRVSRNNRLLKSSFIDVKKAHLCSDVLRELYVEPPPEANEPPDIVWRLQRAMYGTRDAAAAWEREWTKNVEFGWVEVRILNRYVRWKSDGGKNWMEYEPDPRHAELIVKSLKVESAKGVTTPSVKKRLEDVLTTSPQLDALQTRKYRSVVMRAAYLSQDRPDLSYSTKELARDMQKPTEQSMTNLKRLGRHLKKRPRLVQLFVEQRSTTNVVRLDVYGDSDHAGCLKTRKSTTGMVLMRDAHCLKVSSHTQSTISLSSGES